MPCPLHFVSAPGQIASREQSSPLQPLSHVQRASCEQRPCGPQSDRQDMGCMQSWPPKPERVHLQNKPPAPSTHSPFPPHRLGHGSKVSRAATSL
mmetsp:Transcript_123592/g.357446  ORF Transcript_123592/g.357446 Transcript_123592/m.357446 type:complete len:95 (-) Transcript_123592:1158-1442(-)